MWSYECIFECIDKNNEVTGALINISETIVVENGKQALEYAIEELKLNEDYILVGIIRRHAIIKIIKN
jgi:hypothetical protein